MSNDIKSLVVSALEELSANDVHAIAQECNSYDGSCESFCWFYFDDDFFDTFFYRKPMEAALAVHFGNINWSDEWIRFNSYGNLISTGFLDYDRWELEEIAEAIIDLRDHICLPAELDDLFTEIEAGEEVPLF